MNFSPRTERNEERLLPKLSLRIVPGTLIKDLPILLQTLQLPLISRQHGR